MLLDSANIMQSVDELKCLVLSLSLLREVNIQSIFREINSVYAECSLHANAKQYNLVFFLFYLLAAQKHY